MRAVTETATMTAGFVLDERIGSTSVPVADWPLCHLRLKDDSRFPWLLLIPRRAGVVEYADLSGEEYARLSVETLGATRLVAEVAKPDKINVAMLGNVVPQMHVHVVGRFRADPAWPDPVWCHGAGPQYEKTVLDQLLKELREGASELFLT